MLNHILIKRTLFIITSSLYLIDNYHDNKYDRYFWLIFRLVSLALVIVLFILPMGINIISYIDKSWWTIIPLVTYGIYFFITYLEGLEISGLHSYSLALSTNLITMNGYLYEVPRFIKYIGLSETFKMYRWDNTVYSIPIFFLLLMKFNFKLNTRLLFIILIYSIYVISYYNPILQSIKQYLDINLGLGYGMSFYRIITLTLLLLIVKGVNE